MSADMDRLLASVYDPSTDENATRLECGCRTRCVPMRYENAVYGEWPLTEIHPKVIRPGRWLYWCDKHGTYTPEVSA